MLAVQFIAYPPVVVTSWVELLTALPVIAAIVTLYHARIECHHTGCHRVGRHPYGPYMLCRLHHPIVPSHGRITTEHIAQV